MLLLFLLQSCLQIISIRLLHKAKTLMVQYIHVLLILKPQHINHSVYPRRDEPTRFLVDAFLTFLVGQCVECSHFHQVKGEMELGGRK